MEPRCALCHKTIEELAKEELEAGYYNRTDLRVELSDKLCYPYLLCGACDELIRIAVPAVLEDMGIVKLDEKTQKYQLIK